MPTRISSERYITSATFFFLNMSRPECGLPTPRWMLYGGSAFSSSTFPSSYTLSTFRVSTSSSKQTSKIRQYSVRAVFKMLVFPDIENVLTGEEHGSASESGMTISLILTSVDWRTEHGISTHQSALLHSSGRRKSAHAWIFEHHFFEAIWLEGQ